MPKKKSCRKVEKKVKEVPQTIIVPVPDQTIMDFKKPLILHGLSPDAIEFQDTKDGMGYLYLPASKLLFKMVTVTQEVEVKKRRIGF